MTEPIDLAHEPEVILLAAASAHNDSSARRAIAEFGFRHKVLSTLDRFGYLIRTGSEWRIDPSLRQAVLDNSLVRGSIWRAAHAHYFSVAEGARLDDEPAYQQLGPGYAYHGSEVDLEKGIDGYRRVAHVDSLSISLEALLLANEQGQRGVIDLASQELQFLRGMTYYRMGREKSAIDIFRKISRSRDGSREVAVAQHLVAHWDCQGGDATKAEESRRLFRESLKSGVARDDIQHQAHVKHSMALCLLQQKKPHYDRAVELLSSSLELSSQSGDDWGRAKVLHSLGRVLAQRKGTRKRALRFLEESREIGERFGYQNHVEWVNASILELTSRVAPTSQRNQAAKIRRSRRRRRQ